MGRELRLETQAQTKVTKRERDRRSSKSTSVISHGKSKSDTLTSAAALSRVPTLGEGGGHGIDWSQGQPGSPCLRCEHVTQPLTPEKGIENINKIKTQENAALLLLLCGTLHTYPTLLWVFFVFAFLFFVFCFLVCGGGKSSRPSALAAALSGHASHVLQRQPALSSVRAVSVSSARCA